MSTCAAKTCMPGAFWDPSDQRLDVGMCRVLITYKPKFVQ
jgi:hypothetical protein